MAEDGEQAAVSPQGEAGEEAAESGVAAAAAGAAEPVPPAAGSPGTEEPAGDAKKKIDVLLKAVGDTPIMRTKKWAVERTRTIQGLVDFIKKFLKLMASEQLYGRAVDHPIGECIQHLAGAHLEVMLPLYPAVKFIYVNQSFAPSPDQEVGTLYECFGSDGKLVLHYCKTQAWG